MTAPQQLATDAWRSARSSRLVTVFGLLSILPPAISTCGFLWRHWLRPTRTSLAKYGATRLSGTNRGWALVTGGSGGIGEGYVRVLAKRGFNIVIVARRQAPMDALVAELEAMRGKELPEDLQFLTISADATDASPANIERITREVGDIPLRLLVNNVGVGAAHALFLTETTASTIADTVHANALFPTLLTQSLLSTLQKHTPSAIVNVGSLTSGLPMPLYCTYAATKAFNAHFSRCLAAELRASEDGAGIDVLCVRPGLTVSPMAGVSVASLSIPSAETMAEASVRALAMHPADAVVVPYWVHDMMGALARALPERLLGSLTFGANNAVRDGCRRTQ